MSGRVLLALVMAVTTTSAAFAQRLPQPASLSETVSWSSGVAYAYDPSGNIVTAGADTYGYDGVGRLVRSTVNGTERRYAYDAHGNMISCVQWPDTPSASPCSLAGYGVSAATNRLTAAVDTDSDPTNDTYDAAGNVVRLAGHTYTYDALDMQVSDSSALGEREYVYDADGERIAIHLLPPGAPPPGQQKLGEWRWTFRDASGKVLREFRSADTTSGLGGWTWVRDYVWRDGQLLASLQRDASGALVTYHYHVDHLGTPRRVTDDADRIVGIHDYHPFGVELSSSQDEPPGGSMRFTGHERDAFESDWTTTLDYMHARFYSSAASRFFSVDPGHDWDPQQPQSWNVYAYVRNNPINRTDPTGRCGQSASFVGPRQPCVQVAMQAAANAGRSVVKFIETHDITLSVGGTVTVMGGVTGGGVDVRLVADSRGTVGVRLSAIGRVGVGASVGANVVGGVDLNSSVKSGFQQSAQLTVEGGKVLGGGGSVGVDEAGSISGAKDASLRGGLEVGGAVTLDGVTSYTFATNIRGNTVGPGTPTFKQATEPCETKDCTQ